MDRTCERRLQPEAAWARCVRPDGIFIVSPGSCHDGGVAWSGTSYCSLRKFVCFLKPSWSCATTLCKWNDCSSEDTKKSGMVVFFLLHSTYTSRTTLQTLFSTCGEGINKLSNDVYSCQYWNFLFIMLAFWGSYFMNTEEAQCCLFVFFVYL